MIHPTAIIHPQAKLGAAVRVGPYAVIDADVEWARTAWSGRMFI